MSTPHRHFFSLFTGNKPLFWLHYYQYDSRKVMCLPIRAYTITIAIHSYEASYTKALTEPVRDQILSQRA
jgi:hypothetical protein